MIRAVEPNFSNRTPTKDDAFFGLDASAPRAAAGKAALLREAKAMHAPSQGCEETSLNV